MGKKDDEDMMDLLGFKYGQRLKPQTAFQSASVQPQTKTSEPQPTISQSQALPEYPEDIRFSKSVLIFRLTEAIAECMDDKMARLLIDVLAFVKYSFPLLHDKDGKFKPVKP